MSKPLRLGISPCPNDTYIFHALLHGLVPLPCELELVIADVEDLNARAVAGALEVSKLSVGVTPEVAGTYALLRSGAALGWGCGPLVVARAPLTVDAWKNARVAIPGRRTTANLLLDIHGAFQGPRQEMVFDQVIPTVVRGHAELGVIIHEGRFTYADYGLYKILDLGAWWEGSFHMPLPLGMIAVRRDVDKETALAVEKAIAASIAYARSHPEASQDFIRAHAQELSAEVTQAHIATFVNDFSVDLGEQGRRAMELLVERAAALRGIELENSLFLSA